MAVTERVVYSDLYIDFDKHPITNRLLRKTNVDAVKQSIRYLLLTDKGERLFQPEIGGNIRSLLFENVSPHTFVTASTQIKNTLAKYEPRAEVLDVTVTETSNPHEVLISILFAIVNIQEPVRLEIILERVR